MSSLTLLVIIYSLIFIVVGVLAFLLSKKVERQTNTLISILNSFSNMEDSIDVVVFKSDALKEKMEKFSKEYDELMSRKFENMGERVRNLETAVNDRLGDVDRRLNTMYMSCSRKIEMCSILEKKKD